MNMLATSGIGTPGMWLGFVGFVLLMLALDLGVFHRKAHTISAKEALGWSAVWVSLALIFSAGLYVRFGSTLASEFLSGYLIEKSLSIDNVFVFVVIFSALRIPQLQQHRVLFWGVLGALIMRAVMIAAGAALLSRFHWLMYVFGAFLVFTGVKLFIERHAAAEMPDGWMMRMVRKAIPTTDKLDGGHFFTLENGKRLATPLFLALVLVELADVIFALDSIPAIFAVTEDPFIVFTSNIFAILGLRSLFFLLAGAVDSFRYLKVGLSGVLVFVGVKMLIVDHLKISPFASLAVIAALLGGSIVASIIVRRKHDALAAAAIAAGPTHESKRASA